MSQKRTRPPEGSDDDEKPPLPPLKKGPMVRAFANGRLFNHRLVEKKGAIDVTEGIAAIQQSPTLDRFVSVSREDLKACIGLTQRDMDFHIATNYLKNQLLGGSVTFDRIVRPVTGMSKDVSADDARLMSAIWSDVLAQIMCSVIEVGFAAVTLEPHDQLYVIPSVLNLTKVEVLVYENYKRQRAWAYRLLKHGSVGASSGGNVVQSAVDQGLGLTGTGSDGLIPDVMTFCYDKGPDEKGKLTSLAKLALPGIAHVKKQQLQKEEAEAARAKRAWFMEENKSAAITRNNENPTLQNGPDEEDDIKVAKRREEEDLVLQEMVKQVGSQQLREMKDRDQDIRRMGTDLKGSGVGARIQVAAGHVMKPAPLAEVPSDYAAMVIKQREDVLLSMGVPPSLLMNETVNGRTSASDQSMEIAHATVRVEKQRAIQAAYDLWHFAYDAYLIALSMHRPTTFDDNRDVTDVNINLSGIPPRAILQQYYEQGLMKYKAFTRHISADDSIPPEDLNEEKPDPPKTEYVEPPPPGAAAPKSKAKAKSKGKAKAKKKT